MKKINIRAFGSLDEINVEITGNDYETIFNQIESAIRETYGNSKNRGRYFGFRVSVGENHLYFGIGLSGDRSGLICWNTYHSMNHLASGKLNYRRYVDGAFWAMVSMIINHFGLDEYDADSEWENILNLSEYENDQMAQLESVIDQSIEIINEEKSQCKHYVDFYLFPDGEDCDDETVRDWITESVESIKNGLFDIAKARGEFLQNMSHYTECDFTLADCYSESPVIPLTPYYAELDDFDPTQAFDEILDYIFESAINDYGAMPEDCETMLSLRDTLYHYLIAA